MRSWHLFILGALISGCGNSHERTGESTLFHSGKLNVKLVQIYTAMPWHYYGLSHEVWCQSPQTAELDSPEIERGWSLLGRSSISEPGQSPSDETKRGALSKAATEGAQHLHVLSENAVVFAEGDVFAVSFDGCQHVSFWNASDAYNVTYTDIQLNSFTKEFSFVAHSTVYKNGKLLVTTKDAGMHWEVAKEPTTATHNTPTP